MLNSIRDFGVADKRVLVRCDFNVPQDEQGNITDDFRISQTIPTIKYLIDNKAKVILMSHLGDPDGRVVDSLNLSPIAKKLSEYLGQEVGKTNDCIGKEVASIVDVLEPGKVILLENLRFHKAEALYDLDFARELASLADVYVNDAFGACHRHHSSISGVPLFLHHCAGLLLEKEVNALDKILLNPKKPMVAIVGGRKVQTKSKFIDRISEVADTVIISGLLKKEVLEQNFTFNHPEKIVGPNKDLAALDINEESIKMFEKKISPILRPI